MKRLFLYFLSFTFILFSSCEDDTIVNSSSNDIVVSAYLYANQPINDIQITSTLPLGSQDTIAPPVSDANVTIIKASKEYMLFSDVNRPGYYTYEANDLNILSGDVLDLVVEHNAEVVKSKTSVPQKPLNPELDDDQLVVPDFSNFRFGDRPDPEETSISLTWTNEDDSYYYVVVESADESAEEIETGFGFGGGRFFISEPRQTDEFNINFGLLTHYGKQRLILYKVNEEYADLYESREQDSRNLNEPLTNIENGFGIFTAFASDTLFFNVVKE